MTTNIGIIGQGRFGQLLKSILEKSHNVTSCDAGITQVVLEQPVIFLAVPIRAFKKTLEAMANQLKPNTLIIDVCSVKVYPTLYMQELLPKHCDIIATHPLFGPDSFHESSTKKIMMHCVRDQQNQYPYWKNFFASQSIQVVEMTPDEHDQVMARSQGITHLIGRALEEINAQSTPLNTKGFEQLLKIKEQTCNDTMELFHDLQRYNPYAEIENKKLLTAIESLLN